MPGLVKIGMTKRSPSIRANELASQTGIPTNFNVEYAVRVKNSYSVEQRVHRKLNKYRVNKNREFFRVDVGIAKKVLDQESKKERVAKFRKRRGWFANIMYSLLISVISSVFLIEYIQIPFNFNQNIFYLVSFILTFWILSSDSKNKTYKTRYRHKDKKS